MKWFKHLTGSLNNSDIFEAIEKFGPEGYLVFFGTLELMADEFDPNQPGICRISTKKLTKNLQLSRQKTVKILKYFHEKERIFIQDDGDYVLLNCPKLAELSDEYTTRKKKEMSGQSPDSYRDKLQPIEAEVEVEVEDKELKASEPFRLPSKDDIENSSKPLLLENIDKAADDLYEKKIWPKVHAYKNAMLKRGCNERAILKSLVQCLVRPPDNPWAYCQAIMKKEDGNFNARDYEKNHG